jgi:hypothetical protein
MKLSALLFTSAFALRVASLTLGPECLGLESSGLVERVEGTACYTKCESQDDCDPDSSCPNCACGWVCTLCPSNPKLHLSNDSLTSRKTVQTPTSEKA